MQNHGRGRTLQGCSLTTQRGQPNSKGPSWWGRLASASKTRQNLRSRRCSAKKWVFRCANNNSNLLPNRTVIYPANLLSHRQTQLSRQTLAEDMGNKKKTLWLQHAYEQTHVRACTCDSEKTVILTVKFLSLVSSVENHHHLFSPLVTSNLAF